MTEQATNLSRAMALAFAEIEGATKDKVNPHFKSKYADLASALDAVRPVFAKHSLAVTQETAPSEDGVIVETVVLHSSGEDRRFGKLYVPANKRDAQGFGSALTYAKRYSLLTALGIPTEDDDGNAAVASTKASGKVSDEQFRQLQNAVDRTGADLARFCAYFQVPSLKEVPAARFQEALNALEAKAKRGNGLREQLAGSLEAVK